MRIDIIHPETLLQLIVDALSNSPEFKYISGIQPFLMTFSGEHYYVYVKNLSSAYFRERPDTTRAQLPIRPEFDEIKNSAYPFIFFGYDQDNDVLVCWNYHIVKTRLNEKKSVSFYSRQFFQDEVTSGDFLRKKLKNGDEPILFKRRDLPQFFSRINTFFTHNEEITNSTIIFDVTNEPSADNSQIDESDPNVKDGKLIKIIDEGLIAKLKTLLSTNHMPAAMREAADFYNGKYPAMKLKDWLNLVKTVNIGNTEDSIYSPDNSIQSERLVAEPKVNDNNTTNNVTLKGYSHSCKKKTYILRVTYSDGRIVEERVVYKTLLDVVKTAGVENVKKLGIMINGVNLVSDIINPVYYERNAQKPVGNGLYLMTCCDTDTKQQQIERISDAFGLHLKVDKVSII